jgi:hypothetical protein
LKPVVESLRPIALDDLDAAAALLSRLDRKYVVSLDDLACVLGDLHDSYRVLEIAGVRQFRYRSTYFDTADLATFRDHVQRRRRRFKVRAREYVDSGACALEVKLKGTRGLTVKRRMTYDPRLAGALNDSAAAFLADSLQCEYGHPPPAAMLATLVMRFERITLVAERLRQRVTIDTGLVFRAPDGTVGRMAPDVAIVESKSPGGATAVDRVLRAAGARPEPACSKYCLGVSLVRADVRGNA